jgi:hypothetical protein
MVGGMVMELHVEYRTFRPLPTQVRQGCNTNSNSSSRSNGSGSAGPCQSSGRAVPVREWVGSAHITPAFKLGWDARYPGVVG